MTVKRRIYVCEDTHATEASHKFRLIRASNPAQVRNHAGRTRFKVSVASQDDLELHGMKNHLEVEEAGAEDDGEE